jgi:hypothetical protein
VNVRSIIFPRSDRSEHPFSRASIPSSSLGESKTLPVNVWSIVKNQDITSVRSELMRRVAGLDVLSAWAIRSERLLLLG